MSGYHVPYSVVRLGSGRPPTPIVDRRLVQPPAPAPVKTVVRASINCDGVIAPRFDIQSADMSRLQHFPVRRLTVICAQETGISIAEICGQGRTIAVTKARQILMWMIVTRTSSSVTTAGRRVGGRDHSTALHAVERVQGVWDRQNPPVPLRSMDRFGFESGLLRERLVVRWLWRADWTAGNAPTVLTFSKDKCVEVIAAYDEAKPAAMEVRHQIAQRIGYKNWDALRSANRRARMTIQSYGVTE